MSGEIDLTDLDDDGFVIVTAENITEPFLGVSDAGDVNGDGFADIIVGVHKDAAGGIDAGAAYVIYGDGNDFGTIDLTTLTAAQGFAIQGDQASENAGYSVSGAGDVNGDGFDDVIVGARRSDVGGDSIGAAYVIFGSATEHGTIDASTLTAAQGFTLRGVASGDRFGFSVSSAGDVDSDGIDDLIFGAVNNDDGDVDAGAAYVIYGQSGGFGAIDLANLGGSEGFAIIGAQAGAYAGYSVSSAGDINGDGIDDVILGAPLNGDGGSRAGKSYIIFGSTTAHNAVDLATLSAAQGFAIQGEPSDVSGARVSNAGDINDDGIDDLIVAAYSNGQGGAAAGGAYILYGDAGGFDPLVDLSTLTAAQGFFIQGDAAGDYAGFSASAAGDFDGDGIDDLIIGAALADGPATNGGEAYIIYGRGGMRADLNLGDLNAGDGLILGGTQENALAGASVSGAGDVNGDGFDDVIVGAVGSSAGTVGTIAQGQAFVVYGRERGSLDFVGTAGSDSLLGATGDDVISGLDGDDVISGAGGNDALRGGAGKDNLDGGNDDDDLNGGSGNDTLTGGNGDDSLVGSSGVDRLTGGDGDDTLLAGSDNDRADGGDGDDSIFGKSGNDTLIGGDGSDKIDGGSGNDSLDGGTGSDMMTGGSGDDLYIVSGAGDRVIEDDDSGIDTIESAITLSLAGGFVENLTLTGTAANNATGNNLANILTGNSASNTLTGGAGADRLIGDKGKDVMTGGTQADQFRFATGDTANTTGNADQITDFSQAQGDTIFLSQIDARAGTAANDAFTFIGGAAFSNTEGQLRVVSAGGNTFVQGDTNGDSAADFVIRIDGLVTLVAADFVL